jgi:nitroimidazol reductase NimA-like FMN-containing flavoprotein (pyridoxamine 5'-phosphate oxidase superfamily)
MAAYGVPDDLDGALPWSWAEERLRTTRNFWLVTVNGDGRPHALPVWGIWLPERQRFGFSCAPTARKARNIAANDQVVFTTDNSVECVSVEGLAVAIDGAERIAVAEAWARKYVDGTQTLEEMEAFFSENAAYEVIPDRAFGIIETEELFSTAATRWVWD